MRQAARGGTLAITALAITALSSPARFLLQPHASPAGDAGRTLRNQLDAGFVERRYQFRERIDVAANDAVAGFHALNCRHRKLSQFRQLALIKLGQGARRTQLFRRNHV